MLCNLAEQRTDPFSM